MKLHLDFETFSELNLKKSGAWVYAQHASTEILCMAWAFDDEEPTVWKPGDPLPKRVIRHIERGGIVYAHNAMFEYLIWNFVAPLEWGALEVRQLRCTAAYAAAAGYPRALDRVTEVLGLEERKDADGKRVMMKLSKPRKPSKHNSATRWTIDAVPDDYAKLYAYCAQDVRSERAVEEAVPSLPPELQNGWFVDFCINARGIPLDLEATHAAIRFAQAYEAELHAEAEELTDGIRITQVDKCKEFCGLPNLQKNTVDEALAGDALTPDARRVLEIRQELAKISTKKLLAFLLVACRDARARGTLMFHGAHTGRLTGKLIQPHNFPRGYDDPAFIAQFFEILLEDPLSLPLFYERPMEVLSGVLRAFIAAPPGRLLWVADYSAIEIRILAWLAGQDDLIELFNEGADVYIEMAMVIFGKPASEISSDERKLGKDTVLGCGYQMGANTFVEQLYARGGFNLDESIARKSVRDFRERFSKIPALWDTLDNAVVTAVARRGKHFKLKLTHTTLRFHCDDFALWVTLPSGRKLCYPSPELRMHRAKYTVIDEDGNKKTKYGREKLTVFYRTEEKNQWRFTSLYGGKEAENFTQAIAFDLMFAGMCRVEDAGYGVISTVHDEVLAETDDDFGSLEEYIALLTQLESWAAGIPLSAKGFTATRWRKD